MFFLSLCCHVILGVIIVGYQFLPQFNQVEPPVTYVDMVTLPVAAPQAGSPAAEPASKEAAAAAAPTPAPPPQAMALPPKPQAKTPSKAPSKVKPAAEDARQFNERLAKIERLADEKRQAAVLDRLRKGKGKIGMPGGTGTEAGSDYSAYLQNRLHEAFTAPITKVKSPRVDVIITIDPDGRIADFQLEKRSGDPLFDDAVVRAVTIAGSSMRPLRRGTQLKLGFSFGPEKVKVR